MLFLAVHIFSFEKTSISNIMNILEWTHFRYFIFFVLGTITKDYFHEFEHYLDGKFFISIIIVLFVLCQIIYFKFDNKINSSLIL